MVCHRSDHEALTCDSQQCADGALRVGNSKASVTPTPFASENFHDENQFRIVSASVKYPTLRPADLGPNMWAVKSGLP
jgi:hypothetical protein